LEKFSEQKKKHYQKNVRSLDSSLTKIRETTNVLQRQLHPLTQVSPQRSNHSNDATFKEWFPTAANKTLWNSLIETHFQKLCANSTIHEYVPYDRLPDFSEGVP